jgi:glutamate---cysteine ligase / carboxylate-amine ligase
MKKLSLFTAYGIELEYMIVNEDSLEIAPIADHLIFEVMKEYEDEVERGKLAWSHELVSHVLEIKTNGPARSLDSLASDFQNEIQAINQLLKKYSAKLLSTGAHPWMDSLTQTKLWPYNDEIYKAYDRIFNCCGHGWSNLQSIHLNLPFANDEEFAKLHAAIRLLLPIIPALCASTPIIEGKFTGFFDTRLEFYRNNQRKVPHITGDVVPEAVTSEKEYHQKILNKMYEQIAEFDKDKILQEEWLNSRGAIARFDRSAIEIRICDIQEFPGADLAIISLVVAVLKALVNETWQSYSMQLNFSQQDLKTIFLDCIKNGMATVINNRDYLAFFGIKAYQKNARDLWHVIFDNFKNDLTESNITLLLHILHFGNLAERIMASLQETRFFQYQLKEVYQRISNCLNSGTLYIP